MSVLNWNCRGIGLPSKIQFLKDVVRQERPDFIFLCETIDNKNKMERVRRALRFDGLISVDDVGKSGGLAFLWRHKDQAQLRSESRNHIDMEINMNGKDRWRLTGVYGEPDRNQRRKTWDLLRTLARDSNLPWCTIGDLNNVLSQEDKNGGAPYPSWLIDGFNEVLVDVELIDMDLVGHQFTWEKGRGTTAWTEVRLDRALTTMTWLNMFPVAKLYNLEGSSSDHSPILLTPEGNTKAGVRQKFRFENAWLTEPMCKQLVEESWGPESSEDIQIKIKTCGEKLQQWGKEITSRFGDRIKNCKKEMKRLRKCRDALSVKEFNDAKADLFRILEQREIFWRQRAKQLWLHSGDKNSRYFHAAATARRRNNQIDRLKNGEGCWVDWDEGLAEHITEFYSHLFRATQTNWHEVIDCIDTKITENQNRELLRVVTDEEVRSALFQMDPDKAPGPDGMTPGFYQKHWSIVGDDVVCLVRKFFQDGVMPTGLNDTNVVLIPKKKSPMVVGDLRPISLCNVLARIVTKVMANRMKHMLDEVVSECQSAFIPGRLITDNVMVGYEMIHYVKRKRRGKDGCMAVKIDMSKAYDRIEWGYQRELLCRMGFNDWWVHLVIQCVNSVSYTIIHGTREMGPVVPSRGLRQGDPLSPYLFILCAEGLSALLKKYETQRLLHGIKVSRHAPSVNHLLFADDSYLFCKANEAEALKLMELLQIFEEASGQQVNLSKSTVVFSSNVSLDSKEQVCHLLQMHEANESTVYLGLPNVVGRNKTRVFGFLKEKMKNRVHSWKELWISQAGREVLIKTVAQAMPTYAMSMFLLPNDITKDFERSLSRYWWGIKENDKCGIHWMKWSRLSKHKSNGGMGFRDFREFNLALLGKQAWRLATQTKTLASKVYKARYFADCHFFDSKLGDNPSLIWRSIWEAKSVVMAGARWKVGDGSQIKIRGHPWLQGVTNPCVTSKLQGLKNATVMSLMDMEGQHWDIDILKDLFNQRDQQCILSTNIGGEMSQISCIGMQISVVNIR